MLGRSIHWLYAWSFLLAVAGCVDPSQLGGDGAQGGPPDLAAVDTAAPPSPDLTGADLTATTDLTMTTTDLTMTTTDLTMTTTDLTMTTTDLTMTTTDLTMEGPVVLSGTFVGGGPAAQAGNYELRVQLLFSGGAVLQSGNYTLEGWLR